MKLPMSGYGVSQPSYSAEAGEHSSLRRGGKKKKRGEKKKKKGEGKKEEKREEKGERRGKEGNLKSCISVSIGIATADSLVGAVSACLGLISAAKQFPPPPPHFLLPTPHMICTLSRCNLL